MGAGQCANAPYICYDPQVEEAQTVKVELTPDAAQWVEAELAAGRFATAEDAVRYAIIWAKRAELREMLESAEAEGGSHSGEDVRRYVREHLDRLNQTPKAS